MLSSARKRVLEIGTSIGFSAIVIGATLQSIEGAVPLTTIERDPLKMLNLERSTAELIEWLRTCTIITGEPNELAA